MDRGPDPPPARAALNVDVSHDGVRAPISRDRVRGLAGHVLRAEGVGAALISITFVSPRMMARLNRRHLGHRGATDVIAFALGRHGPHDGPIVGDIYIAPAVARANARRFGGRVREEVARLVVHGVLHVVGYEHPEGDERVDSPMWRRQEALLRQAAARGAW